MVYQKTEAGAMWILHWIWWSSWMITEVYWPQNHSCLEKSPQPATARARNKQSSPATCHRGAWGERRYSSYSFTTSALDGVNGQHHAPTALYPRERTPGTHWRGGWVGPRAGLDTEDRGKIICLCRGSNPDRPVVQPIVRHYTAWANPAPGKE
jgi:hypothetical protein